MRWWTIEPRDPLMVRDGRPFGLDTDGARSLPFPPPSVIAGALRTRIGFAARAEGQPRFALSPEEARQIEVRGPLLAEITEETLRLWLPAPRDCVLFEGDERGWKRHALTCTDRWPDGDSRLPDDLLPVAPRGEMPPDKPARDAPAFWSGDELRRWLAGEGDEEILKRGEGLQPLTHERRIHLAIDPATGTGEDGKLFSTDGLRFASQRRSDKGWERRRYLLLAGCEEARLVAGLFPMGGERRLSELAPFSGAAILWDPPKLKGPRARVLLLTPALFEGGSIPKQIGGAKVCAAAVGRPQTLSGWDLSTRSPKPTRRMAPAGSVYWVELELGQDAATWAAEVHGHPISDAEQDRRDGFGLALVGACL